LAWNPVVAMAHIFQAQQSDLAAMLLTSGPFSRRERQRKDGTENCMNLSGTLELNSQSSGVGGECAASGKEQKNKIELY
jgi:hypothetical protein